MNSSFETVRDRLISDFVMRSRLGAYRELLGEALRRGYRIHSVGGMWERIQRGELGSAERHLVLRHDVDTDPGTARMMWAIDRELGIETSYFFRLSTLDERLMADIAAAGGEASYHYEELATIQKRRGLRDASAVMARLSEAQGLFAENLQSLRARTGLPMRTVASHGDFVNVRLNLPNWILLEDPGFREQVGVDLETYDRALLRHLPSRYTDLPYPRFWGPRDPRPAIRAGSPAVQLLVHPRHWRVDWVVNGRDDLWRLVEGARFAVATRPSRRS